MFNNFAVEVATKQASKTPWRHLWSQLPDLQQGFRFSVWCSRPHGCPHGCQGVEMFSLHQRICLQTSFGTSSPHAPRWPYHFSCEMPSQTTCTNKAWRVLIPIRISPGHWPYIIINRDCLCHMPGVTWPSNILSFSLFRLQWLMCHMESLVGSRTSYMYYTQQTGGSTTSYMYYAERSSKLFVTAVSLWI